MIEFSRLTKAYSRRPVLTSLSMRVADGRITGFIGPNGAGKTTAMRLALGLERPDGGCVRFDGLPYARLADPGGTVGSLLDARSMIADLRAIDQLDYCARTLRAPAARIEAVLAIAGLQDARRTRVRDLSLGMRQRLGLAIALLGSPPNLVLDEPLNGLDPSGIHWLRDVLLRLRDEGAAILLSSHIITELELVADDIVVIRDGVVRLSGALADLRRSAGATVHVSGAGIGALAGHVAQAGGTMRASGPAGAVIAGMGAEHVFAIAAASGVVLSELRIETRTLDRVYRDLVEAPGPGERA